MMVLILKIGLWTRKVTGPFEKRGPDLKTEVENDILLVWNRVMIVFIHSPYYHPNYMTWVRIYQNKTTEIHATCTKVDYEHRRTGYFCEGVGGGGGCGAVNHLPKKFLQFAQIFTKQSNRNEGRCNNIGRTGIWKWFHTVFQGQYLPSLSINYVAINKHLEKLPPQLY